METLLRNEQQQREQESDRPSQYNSLPAQLSASTTELFVSTLDLVQQQEQQQQQGHTEADDQEQKERKTEVEALSQSNGMNVGRRREEETTRSALKRDESSKLLPVAQQDEMQKTAKTAMTPSTPTMLASKDDTATCDYEYEDLSNRSGGCGASGVDKSHDFQSTEMELSRRFRITEEKFDRGLSSFYRRTSEKSATRQSKRSSKRIGKAEDSDEDDDMDLDDLQRELARAAQHFFFMSQDDEYSDDDENHMDGYDEDYERGGEQQQLQRRPSQKEGNRQMASPNKERINYNGNKNMEDDRNSLSRDTPKPSFNQYSNTTNSLRMPSLTCSSGSSSSLHALAGTTTDDNDDNDENDDIDNKMKEIITRQNQVNKVLSPAETLDSGARENRSNTTTQISPSHPNREDNELQEDSVLEIASVPVSEDISGSSKDNSGESNTKADARACSPDTSICSTDSALTSSGGMGDNYVACEVIPSATSVNNASIPHLADLGWVSMDDLSTCTGISFPKSSSSQGTADSQFSVTSSMITPITGTTKTDEIAAEPEENNAGDNTTQMHQEDDASFVSRNNNNNETEKTSENEAVASPAVTSLSSLYKKERHPSFFTTTKCLPPPVTSNKMQELTHPELLPSKKSCPPENYRQEKLSGGATSTELSPSIEEKSIIGGKNSVDVDDASNHHHVPVTLSDGDENEELKRGTSTAATHPGRETVADQDLSVMLDDTSTSQEKGDSVNAPKDVKENDPMQDICTPETEGEGEKNDDMVVHDASKSDDDGSTSPLVVALSARSIGSLSMDELLIADDENTKELEMSRHSASESENSSSHYDYNDDKTGTGPAGEVPRTKPERRYSGNIPTMETILESDSIDRPFHDSNASDTDESDNPIEKEKAKASQEPQRLKEKQQAELLHRREYSNYILATSSIASDIDGKRSSALIDENMHTRKNVRRNKLNLTVISCVVALFAILMSICIPLVQYYTEPTPPRKRFKRNSRMLVVDRRHGPNPVPETLKNTPDQTSSSQQHFTERAVKTSIPGKERVEEDLSNKSYIPLESKVESSSHETNTENPKYDDGYDGDNGDNIASVSVKQLRRWSCQALGRHRCPQWGSPADKQ